MVKIMENEKKSHHLWSAGRGESGSINISRAKAEKEDYINTGDEKMATQDEEMRDICNAMWGLIGANMAESHTLHNRIPGDIVQRFNESYKVASNDSPNIYSWDKIAVAFGSDIISDIKESIVNGFKIRLASRTYSVPFLLAADILDDLDQVSKKNAKNIINLIKDGNSTLAIRKFGRVASKVAGSYREYVQTMPKIAVDEKAKNYWQEYYGPFGSELVREVKKRVRADLAKEWMKKYSVDDKAAEYWSNFYGEYGEKWVSIVPKKISPVK